MIKKRFAVVLIGLILSAVEPAVAQVQTQVTVPALTLPAQPQDGDAVVCRPPQQLPGQRLYGPKVCKSQREWDDLHRQGFDIGPDGQSVVASEKFRTLHGCSSGAGC